MAAEGLSDAERDAMWVCQECGSRFVVATLARDCERKDRAVLSQSA